MDIGWTAAIRAMDTRDNSTTISELCDEIALAFLESVGASVGPLYASAFKRAGGSLQRCLNVVWVPLVVKTIPFQISNACGTSRVYHRSSRPPLRNLPTTARHSHS
ncbi:MAG: DAK2 domain-containing protein [Paracoccaceae bacterium]